MSKKPGPNKENLEATRRIFLDIAKKEFSTKGYYTTSTADIVTASGMARGSLYYHFGDKKGLFKAVYEELMITLLDYVQKVIAPIKDPWEAYITACTTFYDLSMNSQTRRVVIDVHTAITYRERIEILEKTLLKLLEDLIVNAQAVGHFKGQKVSAVRLLIFGIISETTRGLEIADDVQVARDEIVEALKLLMEGSRAK
jgi:AcrR family transcriptional regulator